jgi:FkbM family methyltransferase
VNTKLANGILRAYRLVLRTGLLDTELGYAAFERCYDLYKATLEASWLRHVAPLVTPGSTVVDVGAHVGFFTQRFAHAAGASGQVLALEPEPVNYRRLCRRIARTGLHARVTALNVAAVEAPGDYFLRVNPHHPGDHQLASAGLSVVGKTIDELVATRTLPPVSVIKLDVQGAEARVLAGAELTLRRFQPALLVEVDDQRLRAQGSSAQELLDSLAARGYQPRHLTGHGISRILARLDALSVAGSAGQYADFLFESQPPPPREPEPSGDRD